MTPKEKAEQLVFKFRTIPLFDIQDDVKTLAMKINIVAKSNAITCVDEILNFNVFNYESLSIGYDDTWNYWQQVKQEIEKL